jgi:hypothetical protein
MKTRICLVLLACALTGCNLFFGSPSATVEKLQSYAEKGDVDGMNKLFSAQALREPGEAKVRANNQRYSELVKSAIAAGEKPKMYEVKEVVNGDQATVTYRYGESGKDSIQLSFKLSKEDGSWKIDGSQAP